MKEDQELSKKKTSSCFCNFIIGKKKLLVRLHFDNEKSDTTLEERMQLDVILMTLLLLDFDQEMH